ncbi:MAG: enoyl-CoA hydratase/isomerase family protein [Actinomycetota bacterium]|nr:enoyl-CoA hydratase/isomerase family protein [Actinomycetota bacterium]
MSDAPPVLTEVVDSVGRITINRPERRNALSPEVVRDVAEALARYEDEREVRALVLTGAGDRAFCAGGDLGGMTAESKVEQHWQRSEVGDLLVAMRTSRLPIVARVNGHALAGGFGLMLGCDLVVAADDVQMGTPEVNIGLWPFMITAVIQRDIPRKVALELMLTGKRITAQDAQQMGFVNRVVTRAHLDSATDELVGELLSKSPLIVALGKRSFYRAEDMSFRGGLDYLAGMLTVCLESEDTVEGVTAFLQKRAPEWKGR